MTMLSAHQQAAHMRHLLIESYLEDGMEIVGIKLSLTSADAQTRVGTDRPLWGWLTNTMEVTNGDVINRLHDGAVARRHDRPTLGQSAFRVIRTEQGAVARELLRTRVEDVATVHQQRAARTGEVSLFGA